MEIITQREVSAKSFTTREQALNTMTALIGGNFKLDKTRDQTWLVSYEKETSIIMNGEYEVLKSEETEKLTDTQQ